MIGFDTNVMLRLIVQDDQIQTELAANLLKFSQNHGEAIYVSDVSLCETIWTLRAGYHYTKPKLLEVLDRFAETVDFRFESDEAIESAILAYRQGRGDFADYLIRSRSLDAGCRCVATFDKALLKETGFVEVKAV